MKKTELRGTWSPVTVNKGGTGKREKQAGWMLLWRMRAHMRLLVHVWWPAVKRRSKVSVCLGLSAHWMLDRSKTVKELEFKTK